MLIRKLQAAFLVLLCAPFPVNGTTVVVFITQGGVVVSSDSKTVLRNDDFSAAGAIEQPKFVIIQNRIVVTAIGWSDIGSEPLHYNFFTWMQRLQLSLPA